MAHQALLALRGIFFINDVGRELAIFYCRINLTCLYVWDVEQKAALGLRNRPAPRVIRRGARKAKVAVFEETTCFAQRCPCRKSPLGTRLSTPQTHSKYGKLLFLASTLHADQ